MKFKQILFLVVILVYFSCEKETRKNIISISDDQFAMTHKIVGTPILTDNYDKNNDIKIIDSLLILKASFNYGKYFYTVYNKRDLTKIGHFAHRGEGPEEWQYLNDSNQFEKTDSALYIWAHSYRRGELLKININKSLKDSLKYPVVEEKIVINSKVFPFMHLFYVNDSTTIASPRWDDLEQVRIESYDPRTEAIIKSDLFPTMKNSGKLPSAVLNSIYSVRFAKRPNHNDFVQAMYLFNRIDFFDEDLTVQFSLVDGDNWKDNYYDEREFNPDSNYFEGRVKGYEGVTTTENYVVTVDFERKRNQLDDSKIEELHIKIFSWEGKPICLFKIKDDIYSATLDEEEGMLYGIDNNNEKILRYDIKEIMKSW